jgi:hydrogenase maturation protease
LDHFVPGGLNVLMDVVVSGAPPGTIHEIDLGDLGSRLRPGPGPSSHGFGPAEALALADALGRPLPKGVFLGIEGESFTEGAPLSPAVRGALPSYEKRIRSALETLGREEP